MFDHVVLGDVRFCRVASDTENGSENAGSLSGSVPFLNACRTLALALVLGVAAHADPFFWNPSPHLLNGSGLVGASANWSQTAAGGGNWPKSGFDDDFTANTLNTKWNIHLNDNGSGNGSGFANVTTNPGQLTLEAKGIDVWQKDNQYTAVWRNDITGDFDVSVKVVSLTGSTSDWMKTGIMVANDYLDFSKGGCFAVIATSNHGVKVQFDSAGAIGEYDFPADNGVLPLITVFPVYLRAAKKGGVFYGYYKTTLNAPWTLLRTAVPQAPAANSQIGLFGTAHNATAAGRFVFDDFQASGPILANNLDMNFTGTTATANAPALLNTSMTALTVDMAGYAGTFAFGSSTLTVTGAKADFGSTASIDAGTGSLAFTAGAGVTQVFSPAKAGSVFPAIAKSGGGTVQITSRPLTAGFLTLSGGLFDLGNRTNEFTGLAASNGVFAAMGAGDTLIVTGDADFSGITAMPSSGNLQIRSKSTSAAARNVLFTPGNATFPNVYLWAVGAAGFPARITIAKGTLKTNGNLILRDELLAANIRGTLDFQTHNVNVSAEGNIVRAENGLPGTPSQQLLMGSGTWSSKGNVTLSFRNSGSADGSILDLAGASPAVQTLTVSNGPIAHLKHSGSGTLNLGSALNGASLAQTAGILNFDGNNIAVTGNISITNGGSGTLIGLGGRTLSADGSVTLAGKAGNPLNLNPGANWTIFAGGSLSADMADIGRSAATGSEGFATPECNDKGNNTRWNIPVTPPSIVRQPSNFSVMSNQKAVFTIKASGSGTLTYAWRKRGETDILSLDTLYSIDSADPSLDGARYYCTVGNGTQSIESEDGVLTVNEIPTLTPDDPKDLSVVLGQPASFIVAALGTAPFHYRWRKTGDTATVDTNAVLNLAATIEAHDGASWFCTVSNAYGSAVSRKAVLSLYYPATVKVQPGDASVADSANARFSVTGSGTGALSFAWFRSGAPDTLGKDSVLIVKASLADDGKKYFCIVRNAYGHEVSQNATLTVGGAPRIVQPPLDVSVLSGRPASFKVSATGNPPLKYAWFKVGKPDTLSKDSVLSIPFVTTADSGRFRVIVSNGYGSVIREAGLVVTICDSLFQVNPESLIVDEGQPIVLKGKAACSQGYRWSSVSGPAPRILDVEVEDLNVLIPRVDSAAVIVYRFSAEYGSGMIHKDVVVKVREAIPDPKITLPAKAVWQGDKPFILRPIVTNSLALQQSPYSPALRYDWSLSMAIADITQAGDSLAISDPVQDGVVDVKVCVDNGGAPSCAATELTIMREATGLAFGRMRIGPVFLEDGALHWTARGRVRIRDWQGRLLWEDTGEAGRTSQLTTSAYRSLIHRTAFLEVLP